MRPSPPVIALAVLGLVSSGCSFVLTQQPGTQWNAYQPPRCNLSYAAPYADLAMAGLGFPALGISMLAVGDRAPERSRTLRNATIIGIASIPGLLLALGSGWYGMGNVSKCRAVDEGLRTGVGAARAREEEARAARAADREEGAETGATSPPAPDTPAATGEAPFVDFESSEGGETSSQPRPLPDPLPE